MTENVQIREWKINGTEVIVAAVDERFLLATITAADEHTLTLAVTHSFGDNDEPSDDNDVRNRDGSPLAAVVPWSSIRDVVPSEDMFDERW